jgi:Calx-beta domain/FG-GAP-like repeat
MFFEGDFMKKIFGSELSFVDGEDTLLPAGAALVVVSASKLTADVFAPEMTGGGSLVQTSLLQTPAVETATSVVEARPSKPTSTSQSPDPNTISTGAIAPDVVSVTGSSIVFHNTYGSGVTTAYHQAVIDAEQFIESHLTAGSTVDLYASFDFASLGPSFSGQNNFSLYNESYASWRAQLAARSTSPDDAAAVAAIPMNDPTGGLGVYLPSGYARMMGMTVGNDVDAIVLNSDLSFNFANGDATGVLEHELSEGAMGRVSSLGFRSFSNGTHYWNPMDFFRFNASGVRDYTGGQDGVSTYFGFDASHVFTNFQYHNSITAQGQYDGFDLADWDHTTGDAFGPGGPGSPGVVSATDLRVMDVLGWRPVGSDDFPATASTTGVVSVGGSATGNLEVTGDHDWFRVQLTTGVQYTFDLQGDTVGAGTLHDPLMQLFNGSSQFITSDDDGGGNLNSHIVYTPTVTGSYYIDAGAYDNAGTGTYRVSVTGPLFSSVAISDMSISEGDSGTKLMTFTVTRTGGTAAFAVNYATVDNSATVADHDYVARAGTLNFGVGVNTQSISVTINGDPKFESNETFFVNLSGATNGVSISDGQGIGAITNDDALFAPAKFQFAGFAPGAGGWNSDNLYPRELADVNSDGFADIVGFGQSGVYVSLGTGGGNFGTPTFKLAAFAPDVGGWSSDNLYPRELADVNHDGFADIVGFGQSGVSVSLATGGGNFGTPTFKLAAFAPGAGGWSSDDRYPRELADVNGDGFPDIVGFGQSGVSVSLATGGGNFGPATFKLAAFAPGAGGWNSQDRYPRHLADVNRDGMADIVGFGEDGVYVALATGGGNFGTPSFKFAAFAPGAGGWNSNDRYPRELADLNNDGMADIVGFGEDGIYISLATGGGNFATPTFDLRAFAPTVGGWNSDNLNPRYLADINHDGLPDIVGFGQSGVYEALNGFHLV